MDGNGFARGSRAVLTLLLLVSWHVGAQGQPIDGHRSLVGLHYLVDEQAAANADEVLSPDSDPSWHPVMGKVANFGFSGAAYWLRAELPALEPVPWLLELANPSLDQVDVYLVKQGRALPLYRAGESLPFGQRPVLHRNFMFPLTPADSEQTTVLLRVRSAGALQIPISLWQPEAMLASTQNRLVLHGLYFGVMLAALFYCLFAFAVLRDRSYLYLGGFVVATALFQADLNGLSYQFLWPDAPAWNSRSPAFWAAFAVAAGSVFTCSALPLSRRRPALAALLRITTVAAVVMLPASLLLPYAWVARVIYLLAAVMVISALVSGVSLWRFSAKARYFTLAWLSICVGTFLLTADKFGIAPQTYLTENAQQIGSAVGAMLLSAALARRVNRERSRRFRAQSLARQQQSLAQLANERVQRLEQTMRQEIEQAVRQRTAALNRQLRELSRRNAALDQESYLDGLTGLKNRRYFDERYREEWRRAYRDHYLLTLILIDIDSLQTINERGGHLAGDERLREVAQIIEDLAGRPADTVCRFDEDEFAVLTSGTDLDGAVHLAEAICRRVEALPVVDGVSITVSAGVATVMPGERHHEAVLLSFADDALYQAKVTGGNRVQAFELSGGYRSGNPQSI